MSLYVPLGLFAIAAVGGLIMAVRIFGGSQPPWVLSVLHAGLGAAGLVTLVLAMAGGSSQPLVIALALFVAAALGGFFLASFHLRQKPHPKVVLGVHAVAALAGFALLAAAAFGVM